MAKRRISIGWNRLNRLINESIREIICETQEGFNGSTQKSSPRLVNITDPNEISQYIGEVYRMLVDGYKSIEGFFGAENEEVLRSKTSLLTIYTDGEHIYAVGVYSSLHGGKKLFGITKDGSEMGRTGSHLIIKRDIAEWNNWYWCETSGAVEKKFKDFGGIMIPSMYAKEILQRGDIEIIDEYHYERNIAGHPCQKMIFGYRDAEIYNKIRKEIDDGASIDYAENLYKEISEAISDEEKRYQKKIQMACHIIGAVSDNTDEWGMTELTPKEHQAVMDSIETLKNAPKDSRLVQQAIELGQYMLNNYSLFVPHKFGESAEKSAEA